MTWVILKNPRKKEMARTAKGKSRFYRQCRLDEDVVLIIRFYNRHLQDWKNGKKIFLCKDKDEEGHQ